MRTMEETAQLATTTMRRWRVAAVLLAAGAVVLLGLARQRARGARRAGHPEGEAVPLAEVAAAAVRDNPDASRVDLAVPGDLLVPWKAADDLADLLTELVDNAVAFSAPETRVRVGGRKLGRAYVLEIADRGLGMTDGELAAVNRRLAGDPAAGDDPSQRLGAFVVGRLARRHDIDVRLVRSPRGGVTATVLLPERLVVASLPLRRSAPAAEADPPLPRRAPHTSLAPDLAAAGGPGHPVHPVRPVSPRSPEQVRTMLRRYRSGLERGRVAAARDLPDDPLPGPRSP